MVDKLQVTVEVIIHATEDISKIFQAFGVLGLDREAFTAEKAVGHFGNPITVLNAIISKKEAGDFVKRLFRLLPGQQTGELISEIEERTVDSRFHMRLDKQELIRGNLTVGGKDTVKLKIHTPIYNKKDTVMIFTGIFQTA